MSAIARWWSSIAATRSPCRPATKGIRFLLVSGRPIEEPVAWYGPVVMNTEAELRQAFAEIRQGTFIKHQVTAGDASRQTAAYALLAVS